MTVFLKILKNGFKRKFLEIGQKNAVRKYVHVFLYGQNLRKYKDFVILSAWEFPSGKF